MWRDVVESTLPRILLVQFKGPKKSRAPQKVSILYRDHLKSLNWPHLVIWQGRFHNIKPNLQHSCIGNFMQPVLNSFLRPFFGFWSFIHTPPPPTPYLNLTWYCIYCMCLFSVRDGGGGGCVTGVGWGVGGVLTRLTIYTPDVPYCRVSCE
jgi:hypothetical protein